MVKLVENDLENDLENECEHDWEFVSDWEGDPSIANGTHDLSHWRCMACGLEQIETPDGFEPDYDKEDIEIDRQNSKGEYESDFIYDPLAREP
jgi:hypothetical protein